MQVYESLITAGRGTRPRPGIRASLPGSTHFGVSRATYIRELHLLGIVNRGDGDFTLTHKVVVMDVVREEAQSWKGRNDCYRGEGGDARTPIKGNSGRKKG